MKVLQENQSLLKFMATNNSDEYNFKKVMEELSEFQEVIVKQDTKQRAGANRPTDEDVIGEFGDLIMRSMVLLLQKWPEMSVENIVNLVSYHINKKCIRFNDKLLNQTSKDRL